MSQNWHTKTFSYLLILLLIILPIIPFSDKNFKFSTLFGILLFMILIAALIWLNQYLLGLIPVIFNKPWINYIVNVIIHSSFLLIIAANSNKKKNVSP